MFTQRALQPGEMINKRQMDLTGVQPRGGSGGGLASDVQLSDGSPADQPDVITHRHFGHPQEHPIALRHSKESMDPLHKEEDKLVDQYKQLYRKAQQGLLSPVEEAGLLGIMGKLKEIQATRADEASNVLGQLMGQDNVPNNQNRGGNSLEGTENITRGLAQRFSPSHNEPMSEEPHPTEPYEEAQGSETEQLGLSYEEWDQKNASVSNKSVDAYSTSPLRFAHWDRGIKKSWGQSIINNADAEKPDEDHASGGEEFDAQYKIQDEDGDRQGIIPIDGDIEDTEETDDIYPETPEKDYKNNTLAWLTKPDRILSTDKIGKSQNPIVMSSLDTHGNVSKNLWNPQRIIGKNEVD